MDNTAADAIARAFRACAERGCPKCHVLASQHCRNPLSGGRGWINTRFHKPRQSAASVEQIPGPVGIHHLRWQPAVTGAWTGAEITL